MREDTGDEGTESQEVLGTMRNLTTGGKRHLCPYCKYATDVSTCLMRHIRTHTGEKPFFCPYCPVRTTRKASLISHIQCHTGEKPLACNYCSYVSRQKSNMNRHMKKHHMVHKTEDVSLLMSK